MTLSITETHKVMAGLFNTQSQSEQYGRMVSKVVLEAGYYETGENSDVYRKEFEDRGFNYDDEKFRKVCASMFSMLVLSNMRKASYINEEDATEAFREEVSSECTEYLDENPLFEKDLSERNLLRTEAAIWAGRKYFEEEPSKSQASLFNERAESFLGFVEYAEEDYF